MLTVYSAQGSPGASTTVVYLAAQWASTGTEVLLIEADPAGGSLSHRLGIQFTPGLASFIASGLPVEGGNLIDHSQDVLFNNLHIMPSTSSPTGAREIGAWLSARADELRTIAETEMAVIIDAGRITADSAGAALAAHAAGVVVVARGDSSPTSLEHIGSLLSPDVCGAGVERCVVTVGESPLSEEEWREQCDINFCGAVRAAEDVTGDLSAFLNRNKRKSKKWRVSLEQVAEKLLPMARPPVSGVSGAPRVDLAPEEVPAADFAAAAAIGRRSGVIAATAGIHVRSDRAVPPEVFPPFRECRLRHRRRPRPASSGAVRIWLAATVVSILAPGCAGGSPAAATGSLPPAPAPDAGIGPVVEMVPATAAQPPLDADADPRTPLGELRARYLPVWSSDFDWAFPPEVCGSGWAFDAIAEPTSSADVAILGDPVVEAALSVMRFEHLVSRALGDPGVLGQLCVGVVTVGVARSEVLGLLAAYADGGIRRAGGAVHPAEVTVVAAGPAAMLAVACVSPGYPAVVAADGAVLEDAVAPARLQAYLLRVSRGLEDSVADISYRVARTSDSPAPSCGEFGSWVAGWGQRAAEWAAQGGLWDGVDRTVTVEWLCDAPRSASGGECPRDWSS